jgi:hypothetical protein
MRRLLLAAFMALALFFAGRWTVQATDLCLFFHSCPAPAGEYVCGDLGYCAQCPDNQFCLLGRPRYGYSQPLISRLPSPPPGGPPSALPPLALPADLLIPRGVLGQTLPIRRDGPLIPGNPTGASLYTPPATCFYPPGFLPPSSWWTPAPTNPPPGIQAIDVPCLYTY